MKSPHDSVFPFGNNLSLAATFKVNNTEREQGFK
jgi:hypothetical protein